MVSRSFVKNSIVTHVALSFKRKTNDEVLRKSNGASGATT